MGVKIALRRSVVNVEDGHSTCADNDGNAVLPLSEASTRNLVEASSSKWHKGEKNVLDDIMGDPDDFQDLGDPGAGSDGEPGRWEDTCKKCSSQEENFVDGIIQVRNIGIKGRKKDSSDNPRENASIVDSSLTESKQDGENHEDRGISSYRENEPRNSMMADELENHSFVGMSHLNDVRHEKMRTRYFIIKSLSHHNIQLSFERGIWATQVVNEAILEGAFHNSGRVILIFSVNMSGYFQGYAQMISPVGWRRDNVWSESNNGNNPWGRTFKVKWLQLHNLPFQKTLHLKNPLNDYKPVKISRDCQELTQEIGEALCALIDGGSGMNEKLKRSNTFGDEYSVKRPCRESPVLSVSSEERYLFPAHPTQIGWGRTPISYPIAHYQHMMSPKTQSSQMPFVRPPDTMLPNPLHSAPEGKKSSWMRHPYVYKNPKGRQGNKSCCTQLDRKNHPNNLQASYDDSLSEDDILDMTYEEYLESRARTKGSFCHQAGGSSQPLHVKSTGEDDDQYSKYLADWYSSKRRRFMSTITIPQK